MIVVDVKINLFHCHCYCQFIKEETPLIKSFLTQRTKRQKRELTPSDDSDMDASSEASFTSTRDQLEEPPNDISDFASTDPDTIDNR